jgi:putative hydrolase of the HAD superfamily
LIKNNSDKIWLFDYDLTLYGQNQAHILKKLGRSICLYIESRLEVSPLKADELRQQYCKEYGTSLNGLIHHHGINPVDYFDFIHSQPFLEFPMAEAWHQKILPLLKGDKRIFTNGRRDWVGRGLASMAIAEHFSTIYDLEYSDWIGKPAPAGYMKIDVATAHKKKDLIYFDDKSENLDVAAALGWTTVLVGEESGFADYSIKSLNELGDLLEDH